MHDFFTGKINKVLMHHMHRKYYTENGCNILQGLFSILYTSNNDLML